MDLVLSNERLILDGISYYFPQGYALGVKKREWSYLFKSINQNVEKDYLDTLWTHQFSYKVVTQAMLDMLEETYKQFYLAKHTKTLVLTLGGQEKSYSLKQFEKFDYKIMYRDANHCVYSDLSFNLE